MNNRPNEYEFGELESALEPAVQAVLAEPVPDDAIQRVKNRAAGLACPATIPRLPGNWRRRLARYTGLAVAVTLMVTTGVWCLLDQPTGLAFADVLKTIQQVTSLEVTVITRFGMEKPSAGKMYLAEDRLRVEQFDGSLICVCDLRQGTALYQDVQRKLYQLDDIHQDFAKRFASPIDQLRHARPDDAEHVGEERLNGRRAQVYRVREINLLGIGGHGEMLVWADSITELPLKIVLHDPDPKAETEIRFEDFRWNQRLDTGLFTLDPPAGYVRGKVITLPSPRSAEFPEPAPVSPSELARGILCEDRVAGRIVWGPQGTTITAIMRDPESVPPPEQRRCEMRQWNVSTGQLNWSLPVSSAFSLAGTPDGKWLATVEGAEVQLRDPSTGNVMRKWTTDKELLPLAFSSDGKTLAAGIAQWKDPVKGGVQIWDVDSGTLKNSWSEDEVTRFLQYSPDGTHLAGSSTSVMIWDTETGELTRILPCAGQFGFSPDGKHIAGMVPHGDDQSEAGKRYDVRIYELKTGKAVKTLACQHDTKESWILWIEFSPDGRLLAVADWNGTASVWNVDSGRVVKAITEHKAGVHVARFSPDGKTLATGSEDKTLRLWKVEELIGK